MQFVLFCLGVLLLKEVDSQCTAETKPLVVTATGEPQYLTSENYPSDYASNSDCAWQITAAVGEQIVINIEDIAVEGAYSFCYDELLVYDGAHAKAALLGTLCTRADPSANANDPDELVSTSNNYYLTFTSDGSLEYSGFRVLYFVRDAANIPDCGSALVATSTPTTLMSHNIPNLYSTSFSCNYTFTPENAGYGIAFDIKFMDIEVSAACVNDYLRIVEESGEVTNVVYTGCTEADVYDIDVVEAAAPSVELQFLTDSNAATTHLGYLLQYYEVFKGITLTYPTSGSTVSLTTGISEDIAANTALDEIGNGYIKVAAQGTLQLTVFELLSNGTLISATQIDLSTPSNDVYDLISTASGFDYETATSHNFVITAVDTTDAPLVTHSVTYSVRVTDIDDVAPVFVNLPGNATVYRDKTTGYSVFTVASTDADVTSTFQQATYSILSGDETYSMFSIDSSTGELTLAKDLLSTITLAVTAFTLTIQAASGALLKTTSTFEVYVPLDYPPVCTSSSVSGDTLDSYIDQAGKVITYATDWNCTDEYSITYTLGTVIPSLTTTLFAIDSSTSTMTLSRTFVITEVPSGEFVVEIIATDTLSQTTTVTISMNATDSFVPTNATTTASTTTTSKPDDDSDIPLLLIIGLSAVSAFLLLLFISILIVACHLWKKKKKQVGIQEASDKIKRPEVSNQTYLPEVSDTTYRPEVSNQTFRQSRMPRTTITDLRW